MGNYKLIGAILVFAAIVAATGTMASGDYQCSGKCGEVEVGPITCPEHSERPCYLNCTCNPPKIACDSMPEC